MKSCEQKGMMKQIQNGVVTEQNKIKTSLFFDLHFFMW